MMMGVVSSSDQIMHLSGDIEGVKEQTLMGIPGDFIVCCAAAIPNMQS